MDYLPHIPESSPIAPAVELMFHLDGYLPGHSRERLVPDGRMHLVIELDGRPRYIYHNVTGEARQTCQGAWLSGVHSNYILIGDTDSESRLLAIQFAPGGSMPFTHRSAAEFCDAVVPAETVFGNGVLALREDLLSLDDPMAKLSAAEAWLVDCFEAEFLTPDYLQSVLNRLQESPGTIRLTELVAEQSTVSYKHFIDRFRRQVGPGPKGLQRILRFTSVFERLQSQKSVNWAELSLEFGFSDQAHFIREFRTFSGYRPEEFQGMGHDRVNFFPDDPDG